MRDVVLFKKHKSGNLTQLPPHEPDDQILSADGAILCLSIKNRQKMHAFTKYTIAPQFSAHSLQWAEDTVTFTRNKESGHLPIHILQQKQHML